MTTFNADRWARLAGLSTGNETLLSEGVINEAAANKNDIELIQSVLNTLLGDNTLVVDGIWGKNSANAVAELQDEKGLVVDGVVGPATLIAMASMLDDKGLESNLVLGTMIKDNMVIGKAGLIDSQNKESEIEMPDLNIVVGDEDSEKKAQQVLDKLVDASNSDPEFEKNLAALVNAIKDPSSAEEELNAVGDVNVIGDELKVDIPKLGTAVFDYSEDAPRHEEK